MKGKLPLVFFTVLSAFCVNASSQGPIVLYDPASKLPENTHGKADAQLVKSKLVPKVVELWSEDEGCDGSNLEIIGAVDGAFTKIATRQRAIVYELCQTGNGFANNGIAVVERGRVIAHFAVKGGWNLEIGRVSDLNSNGRDEIAIETGGGMHQGVTGSSITILEISETGAAELGVFLAFTNECDEYLPDKYCDRSYKLTAKAGAKPVFFSQKYINRGTDQKPRWVASGKTVRAKRIGDLNTKYEAVK